MLNWLESSSKLNYQTLLNEIRQGNCVAFVGAGLSRNAGYPLWRGLLESLIATAHLGVGVPKEPNVNDYVEIAERCKEQLGEGRYYSLLEEIFDPQVSKQPFLAHHAFLIETPFVAFLTTNYDMCLANAAKLGDKDLQFCIYPNLGLGLADKRPRRIFHLHGIVFDINGQSQSRTTVLTRKQFDDAYVNENFIKNLLRTVFFHHTMLFLGSSLSGVDNDPFLPRILDISMNEFNGLRKKNADLGLPMLPLKRHYAILEMHFETDKTTGTKTTTRDDQRERTENASLEEMGILTIRYPADDAHTKLTTIIEDMMNETRPTKSAELVDVARMR